MYIYTHAHLMVTTNQNSIIDTHKKRERNPNITINIVIRLQGKRIKEEQRNRKELQNNQRTMSKIAISACLSLIALNVNGLNGLIKKLGSVNGLKNKTHTDAAYKRLISDLKSHADWKWKDRKRYFIQMKREKESWASNTYIRQNRL